MGITKTKGFTDSQNRRAVLFKALGHPARIAILQMIIRRKACICNDMVEELPLSQSTISQHLRELKEIGIIKGEIEGTSICYCINETVWREIQADCHSLFSSLKDVDTCC